MNKLCCVKEVTCNTMPWRCFNTLETDRGISVVEVGDVMDQFLDGGEQLRLERGLDHDQVIQHHTLRSATKHLTLEKLSATNDS